MERINRPKSLLPDKPEVRRQTLTDAGMLVNWFIKNDRQPKLSYEFTLAKVPQKGGDRISCDQVIALEPLQKMPCVFKASSIGKKIPACSGIHSAPEDKTPKSVFTLLGAYFQCTAKLIRGGSLLEVEHSACSRLKPILAGLVMGCG